jgi:hypothetical protein
VKWGSRHGEVTKKMPQGTDDGGAKMRLPCWSNERDILGGGAYVWAEKGSGEEWDREPVRE